MTSSAAHPYRGRFAPSPTGPLHFGSLVTALGSYLQARSQGGEWLVRMEDLDRPREVEGAADDILRTLEACGLEWDGEVMYQSQRDSAYLAAAQQLQAQGHVYPCGCSRKAIAEACAALGLPPTLYPGTCRDGLAPGQQPRMLRLRVQDAPQTFVDGLQGSQAQNLAREVGDFVVRRADHLFAYQLAVVVDDAEQGITEIVRGSDLLDSTPRQIFLQNLLSYPQPNYVHLPLALNADGEKLSKQTFAPSIKKSQLIAALWQALEFLGQQPPAALRHSPKNELLSWALANWQLNKVQPEARYCASALNI